MPTGDKFGDQSAGTSYSATRNSKFKIQSSFRGYD